MYHGFGVEFFQHGKDAAFYVERLGRRHVVDRGSTTGRNLGQKNMLRMDADSLKWPVVRWDELRKSGHDGSVATSQIGKCLGKRMG